AELDVIAARKVLLLLIEQPPGHVDVHPVDPIRVVARQSFERGNDAVDSVAHGVGEVASELSGGIREAVGESRRFRVEQQPRGFARARGDYNCAAADLALAARGLVDIRYGGHLSGTVDEELARDGAGEDGQL